MAYSGRCLLSGYINKRDPNQGACTNACRWSYQSHEAQADEVGQYRPVDAELPEPVLVEEQGRPGELMLLDEDEHGSYIFNSKDLRAVQHVPALTAMGVHSLKIEGRTKSPYYVARTAQVYRQAIDDAMAGKSFDPDLLQQLNGMANRGFTEGFLRRHVPADLQNYQTSHSEGEQLLVGEFSGEFNAQGQALLQVKNRFSFDDQLLLMTPQGIRKLESAFYAADGQQLLVAPGSGYQVWFQLPAGVSPDYGFLLKRQKVQAKATCGDTLCQCG
jgi:putative protease